MANVLTNGWLSAPTKKHSFFRDCCASRWNHASDELTAWLSSTLPPTDCKNCRMTLSGKLSVCFLRGASSHDHTHDCARRKQTRSLWESGS